MDSVPPVTLAPSLGALQIGVFVSHVLFGVTTTQTYIYYSRFPEDPPQLKALVSVVWICEFAHAVCIGDALYDYTISNYGHPERLVGALPKSLMATVFLTSMIATLAQGFFTSRVYLLSKRLYIALGIAFMLFLRLISTTAIFATGISMTSLPSFESQWGWIIIVSLAFSSATDLTITTFLVGFLLNQRFGVRNRTMALVDKLIAWTIETALITSISSTVVLACFVTMKTNFVFLAMWVIVARLFANSLLASLNSRAALREMNQVTMTLPTLSLSQAIAPRPDSHIQNPKATQITHDEAGSHDGSHDAEASKDA